MRVLYEHSLLIGFGLGSTVPRNPGTKGRVEKGRFGQLFPGSVHAGGAWRDFRAPPQPPTRVPDSVHGLVSGNARVRSTVILTFISGKLPAQAHSTIVRTRARVAGWLAGWLAGSEASRSEGQM